MSYWGNNQFNYENILAHACVHDHGCHDFYGYDCAHYDHGGHFYVNYHSYVNYFGCANDHDYDHEVLFQQALYAYNYDGHAHAHVRDRIFYHEYVLF